MQISVLGSGSSGNCTYISSGRTCLLVDLGFGKRSLQRRLKDADLDQRPITAVLLTHGHSDHISGVAAFAVQKSIAVFMNEGTRDESPQIQSLDRLEIFDHASSFQIGEICVQAFGVSHDAAQPAGFRFTSNGISGAILTDIGELDSAVIERIKGCDWLVMESNHDEDMVKVGPYPWLLKRRILGSRGHLSNRALAEFLTHQFDGKAAHIFLAHLSRKNNDPEIALASASAALTGRSFGSCAGLRLHLTHQSKPSIVISL
ncbi:MAG: MBL fold metallo-hydrolase [Acidobacteriota bacterium]